jgi:hypothetical protein
MQAEGGLADAGRPDQQSARVLRKPATHNPVELRNPRRYRRPGDPIGDCRVREHCLCSRIDVDAVTGNAKRVFASKVSAAAQLVDLQHPFRPSAVQPRLKLNDSIHQRVLGRALSDVGEQQHRTIDNCRLRLQLMDEFLEFALRTRGLFDDGQRIENENPCLTSANLTAQ